MLSKCYSHVSLFRNPGLPIPTDGAVSSDPITEPYQFGPNTLSNVHTDGEVHVKGAMESCALPVVSGLKGHECPLQPAH